MKTVISPIAANNRKATFFLNMVDLFTAFIESLIAFYLKCDILQEIKLNLEHIKLLFAILLKTVEWPLSDNAE